MFLSIYYLAALVVILTVHEFAHAWVALRLGDPTAERAGRVSLNPMRHLSLLGTVMLFLAGIGWGKPVPVNPRNFENPVRDQAFTAAAGPAANLLLAVAAGMVLNYFPDLLGAGAGLAEASGHLLAFMEAVMTLSLVLFVFNLLPFPPLDGSKVLFLIVPKSLHRKYMEFLQRGMPYFIVLVVMDLYLSPRIFGFSWIWMVVSTVTFWLRTTILVLV